MSVSVFDNINLPTDFIWSLIKKYGADNQPVVCVEELSELQKELCKDMRGKGDVDHITEEITHCLISIAAIMKVYGIDPQKIQEHIDRKIEQYG